MKIYIDPGHNHSGADTGAVGFGLKEQDISVQIGVILHDMLVYSGHTVKMSRENINDNTPHTGLSASLADRYNGANNWGADLFVSIHCNAANTKAYGCETYHCTGSSEGYNLAAAVQPHLVAETGRYNRGVKAANFAVIRHTTMPAILVETAFIDNYDDNKFLSTDSGRHSCALAIYKGIQDYLGNGYDYISESEEEDMSKYDKIIDDIGVDIDTLKKDVKALKPVIYDYIDENMPDWARPTIEKLVTKGYLKGGDEGRLGLTETDLRLYVVNDRAGIYGK